MKTATEYRREIADAGKRNDVLGLAFVCVELATLIEVRGEYRSREAERKRVRRSTSGAGLVAMRTRVLERDGFRCRRCGAAAPSVQIVVDHIIPVALGGRTEDGNLQALCAPCNTGKADRLPTDHDMAATRD